MSEQAVQMPRSPQAIALARHLRETTFSVLQQRDGCITVLGEATVDELLTETEQIEQAREPNLH
jgi:hypothetical protein